MKFLGHYKVSCLITYSSVVFGVLGIIYASNQEIEKALICLILSGIADMFDGKVARHEKRSNQEKEYGVQLDSLADSFNYSALPISIGLSLGLNSWYHILSYIMLVLASVIRLAYFNVYTSDNDKAIKTYTGLPVTSIAFTLPLLWLVKSIIKVPFTITYTIAIALSAFFYILNIKIPKATNKLFYIIMSLLGIIGIILFVIF